MKKILFAITVALAASVAMAQAAKAPVVDTSKYKVLIGTGGAGNTYDTMSNELMRVCAKGDTFGAVNTGGTLENIDNILSNKQDAGWGQEDALFLKKTTNPAVNQLKTLFTLHPEEIHVFVRKNTGLRAQGESKFMGLSKTEGAPIVFNRVEDLKGYKVAAWGGSYDTARLVTNNADIGFEVIKVANQNAAFDALNAGHVQAVLAVAGAPSGAFQALPQGPYKLVGFTDQSVMKLAGIYNGGAILNYSNLDSEGVKTISTNAIMFTREYSDPETLRALAEMRSCYQAAVAKLRDTRGSHAKWRSVNVNNKGKWAWYDLPTATGAAAPAAAKR